MLSGLLFVVAAALCATYLSGLSFPEQNNLWQIPVVLDFAGSAEGPHDAYARSFANFISLFWIAVGAMTGEGALQPVFVGLQLAGNALMATALFALIRQAGGAVRPAALATGFLCFAYGLWGATPLGYSEIFTTYATHSQYAAALGLFALALVSAGRPLAAAAVLGLAADINLFMGVWAAMAAGLALIARARRFPDRAQIGFGLVFLALAGPVAVWGVLAGSGGGAVPYAFLRYFLAGHVFGFDYPRALVQTFALIVAAALATATAGGERARRGLATAMGAVALVLAVGTVMPYLTRNPLLLLLHPLRFVSVAQPMAAACAAFLFVRAWDAPPAARAAQAAFAAAMALAGFLLKMPVLSVAGFALSVPRDRPWARAVGAGLMLAALGALFLPGAAAGADKTALALGLAGVVLALVAAARPAGAPAGVRLAALVAGGATLVAPGAALGVAVVLLAAALLAAAADGCGAAVTPGGMSRADAAPDAVAVADRLAAPGGGAAPGGAAASFPAGRAVSAAAPDAVPGAGPDAGPDGRLRVASCPGASFGRAVLPVALAAWLALMVAAAGDPLRLAVVGVGGVGMLGVSALARLPAGVTGRLRRLGGAALAGLVLALMLAGLARGGRDGFAPAPGAQKRAYAGAQHWVRAHLPPDTTILTPGMADGFALLARRPVWWEASQAAAVLWQPSFYPLWACRRDAVRAVGEDGPALIRLARRAGIAYLVLPVPLAQRRFAGVRPVWHNGFFAVIRVGAGRPGGAPQPPLCPEPRGPGAR